MPCYCMPEIYPFQAENYIEYENILYQDFKTNFIDSRIYFNNKPVQIRKNPVKHEKVHSFYHIICDGYDAYPVVERCERINWAHSFILNYKKCKLHKGCSGIKVWKAPLGDKNNIIRVKMLSVEGKYIVVLEERKDYYLLITAYYIDTDRRLNKLIDEYKLYKKTESAYH